MQEKSVQLWEELVAIEHCVACSVLVFLPSPLLLLFIGLTQIKSWKTRKSKKRMLGRKISDK